MKAYDTFSPAIPEPEEVQETVTLPSAKEVFPEEKKPRVKRGTKGGTNRKKAAVKKTKEPTEPLHVRIIQFLGSETMRWILGLFLGSLAIYLGIAFVSYFTTCIADQAEINNSAIGASGAVANYGGEGGARLSEFLINECFGLGSFVIVLWLFGMSLKHLVGKPKFKTLNFTIKCLVALVTLSLIVGIFTIGFDSPVNWGGFHGRYVNEFVIHFIGWTGAVILCLFMVACFVLICMRDVVKWIMKLRRQYAEKRRIEREKREEELARERELEEMRRYEEAEEGYPVALNNQTTAGEENVVFGNGDESLYENYLDFEDMEYSLPEENLSSIDKEYEENEHEESIYELKENIVDSPAEPNETVVYPESYKLADEIIEGVDNDPEDETVEEYVIYESPAVSEDNKIIDTTVEEEILIEEGTEASSLEEIAQEETQYEPSFSLPENLSIPGLNGETEVQEREKESEVAVFEKLTPEQSLLVEDTQPEVLETVQEVEATAESVHDNPQVSPGPATVSSAIEENETSTSLRTPAIEEADSGLQMVVNVNEISQTSAKRTVIAPLMPGSFPYKFPPYDLMSEGETRVIINEDEQQANKDRIEKTLLDFKIPILKIQATIGPTVTLYEIVPDKGVKVASIKRLVDDIALSLSAEGVRIIAPIPGKGTVGIEVANQKPQKVSMRTIIKSRAFQENNYELPVAIGATISNGVYITDLAKMPHLLVAGATGQGKSVGLNAIITSLLYSKRPDELKFVLIDPKMVEFALYEDIEPHYLAKIPGDQDAIITDMSRAVDTLKSLVVEMENRYRLLKSIHTKHIIEYNRKLKEGNVNPADGHKYLPYIVVVVDEFADLILNVGKEVEIPIARLAQKARAVGIHVIIATQRPSADVITGMIKGNFPARIAFKVASGIDSKTILDQTGAQYLIGKGDMLILNNGPVTRIQCAFIDTPEVESICAHISRQPYGQGAYLLPSPEEENAKESVSGTANIGELDACVPECARLIVSSNHGSTSALQRTFSLGFARAGRIMDQLEGLGIVGPAQGGKTRNVLVDMNRLEEILSNLPKK